MNVRVKEFRERQKSRGLTAVTLWLDQDVATLLKRATETLQMQPGEAVSLALREWKERSESVTETASETITETGSGSACYGNVTETVSDTATLRELIRQIVREEFAGICYGNGFRYSDAVTETEDHACYGNATETVTETVRDPGDHPSSTTWQGEPVSETVADTATETTEDHRDSQNSTPSQGESATDTATETNPSVTETGDESTLGSVTETPLPVPETLPKRMMAAREARNLSQKDLATLAGIRVFTVQRIEAGIIQPTPEQQAKLESVLQ